MKKLTYSQALREDFVLTALDEQVERLGSTQSLVLLSHVNRLSLKEAAAVVLIYTLVQKLHVVVYVLFVVSLLITEFINLVSIDIYIVSFVLLTLERDY